MHTYSKKYDERLIRPSFAFIQKLLHFEKSFRNKYIFFDVKTLPSWLKNDTYQHVLFSFSDEYVEPQYFNESGRQLQDMFHQIISGYAVEITCVSNRKITLQFNFTAISETIVESSYYQLEYIHINYDSVSNYSLEWINEGGHNYTCVCVLCVLIQL